MDTSITTDTSIRGGVADSTSLSVLFRSIGLTSMLAAMLGAATGWLGARMQMEEHWVRHTLASIPPIRSPSRSSTGFGKMARSAGWKLMALLILRALAVSDGS